MSFLTTLLEKLASFFAVYLLGKQSEKANNAEKKADAAVEEAKRLANIPLNPLSAAKRLRERAANKRKTNK